MYFKKFKLKNFEFKIIQEENLFLTIPGMLQGTIKFIAYW